MCRLKTGCQHLPKYVVAVSQRYTERIFFARKVGRQDVETVNSGGRGSRDVTHWETGILL